MKNLSLSLILFLALLCSACADNSKFTIEGDVAGKRTMNLRIVYPGDDNINSVLTAARDGKFTFEGNAPDGALVEIFDNDYRVLGRLYAVNGEEIKVKIDPADQFACNVKGDEISERWCRWNKENARTLGSRNAAAINALIARYIKAHKDDILSTILLISYFDASLDPEQAHALLLSINKEARPASLIDAWTAGNARVGENALKAKVLPINYLDNRDSLRVFTLKGKKLSLLAFSDQYSGRKDSIIPAIKRLRTRVNVLDMSMDADTMSWRRSVRADSVEWSTAWAAGAIAAPGVDRLGIPSVPYFIVADSAGRQLFRGRSIKRAEALVDSILKR